MEDKATKRNMIKKTVIVAGAGGLTGSFLLEKLSKDKSIEHIIVLSRKALKPNLPKVKEVIVDFDRLDRLDFWPDAHALFCCIGTTIKKAGSQENFRKVDYEIPLKLATQCARFNISFHLISSIGANPDSGNFYLKTKGETEEAIKQLDLSSVTIYRPSMLFGPRKESRLGESIGKVFMYMAHPFLLGPLKNYRGIHVATVAQAMINREKNGEKGFHIVESEQIKRIASER